MTADRHPPITGDLPHPVTFTRDHLIAASLRQGLRVTHACPTCVTFAGPGLLSVTVPTGDLP